MTNTSSMAVLKIPRRKGKLIMETALSQGLNGMATILLTEDDTTTRIVVAEILKDNGYHVVTAREGIEALKIIADKSQELDLLLTDVVMPGLNGIDVMLRAAMLRPELKVLLMSGHAKDTLAGKIGMTGTCLPFLEKPFTHKLLVEEVGRVLRLRD